jgi:16S rRNA (cytidine1402-2'-O)-methyltransferase
LAKLASETRTLVFFEAPHRIAETLGDLASEFGGERRAVVTRELTKTHETVYRGKLSDLVQRASDDANFQRGEITLVVSGAEAVAGSVDLQLLKRAVELLGKELPPGRAASIAAQLTGASRSQVYELLTTRSHP